MSRPSKPADVIDFEGKSHRTKKEMEQRRQGEAETLTGEHMKIWTGHDKIGKQEFERVRSLLAIIGKDDALYEAVVNRYAQLKSECVKYERIKKKLAGEANEAAKRLKSKEIEFLDYMNITGRVYQNINATDRQLQAKRKMLLDIEKENIMTIAAALRSVPKTPKKEEKKTGMAAFLAGRGMSGA